MTTAQIFECAVAASTGIASITAYVLVRRRARHESVEWTVEDNVITSDQPLTERQVEEIRARWLKLHGNNRAAHHVKELRPVDEEERP